MKKKIILAAICCLPLSVLAQRGFTIKGKIGTVDAPAMAYLNYTDGGKQVQDSVMLKKGRFSFTGKLTAPTSASIVLKHDNSSQPSSARADYLRLFIENSKIQINSPDSLKSATVKGSASNQQEAILRSWQRPYKKSADSLVAVYNSLSPEGRKDSTFQQSAAKVMRETQRGYDSVSRAFIATFPDSYIALSVFQEVELGYNFNPDTAELRFERLSPSLRSSALGQRIAESILIGKNTNIGVLATDFQQPDTAGNPVKLSNFRGQYVLLEFWASWCVPCRAENPVLLAAYNKYKEKGFNILGVSLDDADARKAWLGAVNHDGLPWTQTSELKGFKSEAAVLYGIKAIPANFLIDPNGRIVAKNLRGEQLGQTLQEILGDSYAITGNLPELQEPAKIYLALVKDGSFRNVDSAVVERGQFRFTGNVDVPQQALLNLVRTDKSGSKQRRDYLSFFIENAEMKVNGKDSLQNVSLTGSRSDMQNREMDLATRPLTDKITAIYDIAETLNEQEKKSAADSVRAWVAAIKAIRVDFVKRNLDNYMGLYTFDMHVLDSKFDPETVEPIYSRFSSSLKATALGQKVQGKIENARKRQTGVVATDFTQNDLEGKPFMLSSLRGKYVLIDFWASWCVPCRAENPHLVKAYEALKDKNFEIVGISLDESKSAWENAINTDKLPWIHVSDLKGWKNEVATLYDIRSVPQNFLIDPQGNIIAKNLRGNDLTKMLQDLIK